MAPGQNCSSPAEERGWTWRSHRGLAVSSHAASADACPIWAGPTRGSRDTRKTRPLPQERTLQGESRGDKGRKGLQAAKTGGTVVARVGPGRAGGLAEEAVLAAGLEG